MDALKEVFDLKYSNYPVLLCPAPRCELSQFTHFVRAYTVTGYEPEYEAMEYEDALMGRSGESFRGDTEVLEFYCEDNHTFELRFSQHKGNTFFEARPTGQTQLSLKNS